MLFPWALQKIGERWYRRAIIAFGVTLVVGHRLDREDCGGILPHGVDEVDSHLLDTLEKLWKVEIVGRFEKFNLLTIFEKSAERSISSWYDFGRRK